MNENIRLELKLYLLAFTPLALLVFVLSAAIFIVSGSSVAEQGLWKNFLMASVVLSIGTFVFCILLVQRVNKALQLLAKVVKNSSHANLSERLPWAGDDVLGLISQDLNKMLDKFQHIIIQLKEAQTKLLDQTGKLQGFNNSARDALKGQQKEIAHISEAT
ncbi:MAG: hypothetical protein ACKOAD_06035, partial [Gammaproteobacteria bacterium]